MSIFLCSCTTIHPETSIFSQDKIDEQSKYAQFTDNKNDSHFLDEKVFTNKQVIVPSQNIEKNGLSVSYSLKTLHESKDSLMQLTFIFQNIKNHRITFNPKINLMYITGTQVRKYTKNEFIQLAKKQKRDLYQGENSPASVENKRVAQDKIDWANSYWLTPKLSILPGGIKIAGLVYRRDELSLPMILRINMLNDKYIFNINELPISNN
jgi:hypothetical protein